MQNCGIYLITCTPPDQRPLYYVGQSSNLAARFRQHRYCLNTGRHHNSKMAAYWAKYGASAFVFSVLDYCEISSLDDYEQWWLGELVGHPNAFNLGTQPGAFMRGVRFSEAHKKKIGDAIRGELHYSKKRPFTDEHRGRMSAASLGKKKSPAHCTNIANGQRGPKSHNYGKVGKLSRCARPVIGRCLSTGCCVILSCAKDGVRCGFNPGKISNCCNGSRPHHCGFVWSFR